MTLIWRVLKHFLFVSVPPVTKESFVLSLYSLPNSSMWHETLFFLNKARPAQHVCGNICCIQLPFTNNEEKKKVTYCRSYTQGGTCAVINTESRPLLESKHGFISPQIPTVSTRRCKTLSLYFYEQECAGRCWTKPSSTRLLLRKGLTSLFLKGKGGKNETAGLIVSNHVWLAGLMC